MKQIMCYAQTHLWTTKLWSTARIREDSSDKVHLRLRCLNWMREYLGLLQSMYGSNSTLSRPFLNTADRRASISELQHRIYIHRGIHQCCSEWSQSLRRDLLAQWRVQLEMKGTLILIIIFQSKFVINLFCCLACWSWNADLLQSHCRFWRSKTVLLPLDLHDVQYLYNKAANYTSTGAVEGRKVSKPSLIALKYSVEPFFTAPFEVRNQYDYLLVGAK